MANITNFNQLFSILDSEMKEIVDNDVAEVVKEIQSQEVHDTVYDVYTPFRYERRSDYGGLSDTRNMFHTVADTMNGLQLTIRNNTTGSYDNNFQIAGLIEYGHDMGYGSYDYDYNRENTEWKFMQPRPFISNTILRLERTLEHVNAMRRGLQNKGFKVE
jgi:hypothetical protein